MASSGGQLSGLQAPLWRAIAVYRIAALIYLAILVVRNVGHYERPMAAWPVLAVTAAWTVVTTYAYADPNRRRVPLLVADLLITMAVMTSSVWIVGRTALEDGRPTQRARRRARHRAGTPGRGRGPGPARCGAVDQGPDRRPRRR